MGSGNYDLGEFACHNGRVWKAIVDEATSEPVWITSDYRLTRYNPVPVASYSVASCFTYVYQFPYISGDLVCSDDAVWVAQPYGGSQSNLVGTTWVSPYEET